MFGIERNHIIAVVAIVVCLYPLWGIYVNKTGRQEKAEKVKAFRRGLIDEKIVSMNGTVIEIEQIKRSDCPVIDVIEIGSQAHHLCYRVSYSVQGRIEETWAIINAKNPKDPVLWPELEDE